MAIEKEVTASNGVKLTTTDNSSTTVTSSSTTTSNAPDNAPPGVPELSDTTIDVGERGDDGSRVLVGVISADDPDGDTLVFTENSDAFEIDNGRLYYIGDRVEDGDSWNIAIAASDGKGAVTSRTFTIRADDGDTVPPPPPPPPPPNRDPDIQVTRQDDAIQAGKAGPFVVATFTVTDPDSDVVALTDSSTVFETRAVGGGIYELVYTGTALAADAADQTVTVRASDGRGGTDAQSFRFDVAAPPNSNPDIHVTGQDDTILAGKAGPLVVATFTVTDPDSDPIVLIDSSSVFETRSLGGGIYELVYTGGALAADAPDQTVTVRANDGRGGTDVQSFRFDVVDPPNQDPEIRVTAQEDTIVAGRAGPFVVATFTVTDADSDPVVVIDSSSAFETRAVGAGIYELVYTGGALDADAADQTVTVRANDGRGGTDVQGFRFDVVAPPNQDPEILVTAQEDTIVAGQAGPFVVATFTVTDADSDPVVVSDNSSAFETRALGQGAYELVYSGAALDLDAPDQTVTVRANDGRGGTDVQGFRFDVVAAPNSAPDIRVTDQDDTIVAGRAGPFVVATFTVTDPDSDAVALTDSSLAFETRAVGAGIYELVYTGAALDVDAADQTVTVRANDGRGGTDAQSFRFDVVAPVNSAPDIRVTDQETTIAAGQAGPLMVARFTVTDPDGDAVAVSDNSSVFETRSLGEGVYELVYTGAALDVDAADQTVTVRASDGHGGSDSQGFRFDVVEPPNADPDIRVTDQDATIVAGKAGPFVVARFTVADPDGDPIVLTDNSSVFETRSVGGGAYELVYSGGALADNAADQAVTVRASDGRGGTDAQSFRFDVVEAPNAAPEITVTQQDPKIPGLPGSFQVARFTVADPDGDTIRISDNSDNFETRSQGDGQYLLMYTGPALPQSAPDQSVTVTASDGRGGSDAQGFTFDVTITVNCAVMVLPDVDIVYGTDGNDDLSASGPSYFAMAAGLYTSGADTLLGSDSADIFDVEPDRDGVWNERIDGGGARDVTIDGVTYLGIDIVCMDRSLDLSVVPLSGAGSILNDVQGYYFHNVVAETFALDTGDIADRADRRLDLDGYAATDAFDYRLAKCLFVFDEPTAESISVRFDLAQGETLVDLNGGNSGRQANDTFRIMGKTFDMNVYGIDNSSDGLADRYLVVEVGADVLFI